MTPVLARIERIEPHEQGGILRRRGPLHVFNGDAYCNETGLIRAWCGARVSTVDLHAVEDRGGKPGALYADLCRRCFVEPRGRA